MTLPSVTPFCHFPSVFLTSGVGISPIDLPFVYSTAVASGLISGAQTWSFANPAIKEFEWASGPAFGKGLPS